MSAFLLGPALGLGPLGFVLTLAEGIVMTLVLALVVERYLFPITAERLAGEVGGEP